MPLESPKLPVQRLHHRASGSSILGGLPVLLAVVLGLFAHSDALAQTSALTGLSLSPGTLDPPFNSGADPEQRTFTAEVAFSVTQVTVTAEAIADWSVTYQGAPDADLNTDGYQRDLRLGANSITVRATPTTGSARNYTITVTRAREIGSALTGLTVTQSGGGGTVGALDPAFSAGNAATSQTFTVDADLLVTQVTVNAEAKAGWEVTYHDDADAEATANYQRNLAVGPNRITVRATAKPTSASGRRNYTITVTRTTTPSEPRNLRATTPDASAVRLSWTAPSSDGGPDIESYERRLKEADADDGQWLDTAADRALWTPVTVLRQESTTSFWTDVSDLTNGIAYIFQVRARNSNGPGRASSTVEATPAAPLPAPVWLDPAVVAGNRRVELRWMRIPALENPTDDDESSVSAYQYRRRVETGSYGGPTTIADRDLVESGTTRSYTVTPLTNGTEYRFQVRAMNSVGGGAWSIERAGTPEEKAPGAPTNLEPTAGDRQVSLSWTASSDTGGETITRYEYRHRPETAAYPAADVGGGWTTTGGTGRTVTVHGLDNGTTYYFQVRAVNDLGCNAAEMEVEGCGLESLEVSATPFGTPVTRVYLNVPDSDRDRQVELTWAIEIEDPDRHGDDNLSGFQYQQKAGGDYGSWIDVRNSNASTTTHVVSGLRNGTPYTFQVRAVNSSGGGLRSNERSAIPSTTPGPPTLTATAGDEEVRLTWTPAASGGRRIIKYECERRIGAGPYEDCPGISLGASATSITLTDEDGGIRNDTTYTFRVRAVNDRENTLETDTGLADGDGDGEWSNDASARPTDSTGRSYTISATIDDGKSSWARADVESELHATVEVNPRFREQSTLRWVKVDNGTAVSVTFGSTDSSGDVTIRVTPSYDMASPYLTIALLRSADDDPNTALAVTRVEVRPNGTPTPPTGLEATRGDGEVTLSWASYDPTVAANANAGNYDYEYRQKRQAGSYGRWTNFAGDEFQRPPDTAVTSNTVTGLTNGGTYTFQVRALLSDEPGAAASDPSDEVSVTASGTTGGLSAPRNFAAAAGNGRVTLSWTAPAADGGAAISGYEYQQKVGAGAYGVWTRIPGSGSSTRSYAVTGLTNGTAYFFRVRAVNSDGAGPASTEESATPSLTVDTTLRALSLSTVTLAPVTLAPAFTPATRIYTAAVGSSVTQVTVTATPNKAGATRTITPANANTTVAGHQVALVVGPNPIRVSVADGTNAGVYTITVTRAGSVPGAPTGLTATAGEEGEVTLSWTAPAGGGAVSRYEYQQKAGAGAYGVWTPIPNSGPSTTSYTVPGLTNGTAYAFRVRAVNSAGNGAASTEATATPTTARLVWAKSEQEVAGVIAAAMAAGLGADMTFSAGELVEILGSALFNAAPGVTLSYKAVSSNSDVASAGIVDTLTVTVTAKAGGMADITITAMASLPSGLTINPQTNPREASITFPVEVDIAALVLELSGPTDMNLVEGGSNHANGTAGRATVTVKANRPVTREVTVTLLADRETSDATAADFEADPIVIAAGETTGSTVVIAREDGTAEDREALVLFGMAADNAGEVKGEVTLYLWDAAVPALPVIAQLLLAAFLLWSGRRYLLRR